MALDLQPVLSSDLLLVRPVVVDDFEALWSIASDPAMWEQHPAKERSQEQGFRAWFDDALASRGALVVIDRADDTVIGSSRYVVWGPDEVEIGWKFLARSRWGGFWNRELKRLMLGHAFAEVSTVAFVVHEDNIRSQRAVERLGAEPAGKDDAHGRGDHLVFTLRRSGS